MGSIPLVSALVAALMLAAAPAPARAQASSGPSIYCCDDEAGRPICGDVLPRQCFGKAYREMSPSGAIRRQVSAPLTAEERARRAAEKRAQEEAEALARIQRRQDEALIETYPTLESITDREQRAIADVERSILVVAERESELLEQRARLLAEAEFYQGRELPRELESNLRLTETELSAYQSVIASKELEIQAIRERYESDRQRYLKLIDAGFTSRN